MATRIKPRPERSSARAAAQGLGPQGLQPVGEVHWNSIPPELVQAAIRRGEGELADMGPFVAVTSPHTGRSPNDKFVVQEPGTEKDVWWGKVNVAFDAEKFDELLSDVQHYLDEQAELFVQDLYAGPTRPPRARTFVTPTAWHSLFGGPFPPDPIDLQRSRPTSAASRAGIPPIPRSTARAPHLHHPEFRKQSSHRRHSLRGELKKAIFRDELLLPKRGVLSMHCSANVGHGGDTALFFGLSGTGKTTLSADPDRWLIGDDEHGWSSDGVFNFEGGCYAKVINLSEDGEPDIYRTTQMFGTILENVVLERTRAASISSIHQLRTTRHRNRCIHPDIVRPARRPPTNVCSHRRCVRVLPRSPA